MNRELLFRAKCVDDSPYNGKWVYGSCLQSESKEMRYSIVDHCGNVYFVDQNTIGQYTGLEDRNGVKIFEDDIVRFKPDYDYYVSTDGNMVGCVRYGHAKIDTSNYAVPGANTQSIITNCFGFYISRTFCIGEGVFPFGELLSPYVKYEVIGNIHDNQDC